MAKGASIFGDPIIATAILDRLLHHSTAVNIRGESYWLKDRRKAGLIPSPARQEPDSPATAQNVRNGGSIRYEFFTAWQICQSDVWLVSGGRRSCFRLRPPVPSFR